MIDMVKKYFGVFLLAGLVAGCQTPLKTVSKNTPVLAKKLQSPKNAGFDDGLNEEDATNEESDLGSGENSDGCIVTADPETIEDLELLSDADKLPPEDEGVTAIEQDSIYDLPVVENEKVRYFIDYYTNRGSRGFRRWLERSGRYVPMMQAIFAEHGLPGDLVYLVMIESGFNEKARSRANAVGPWQFMAGTGKLYDLKNDWWFDERRDPVKATVAAARHLRDLYARFDGEWNLAIAAYNAGAGKVGQAIRNADSRDFWKICRMGHLPQETRNYLPKLYAVLHIAKNPAKYGFENIDYQAPLAYDVVELPGSTDLDIVARLCDVEMDEIQKLNPELKRWCTPPGIKDYKLRIPAGKREAFLTAFAEVPVSRRASYHHYRIRSGDTLGAIAARFSIKTQDIMRLNRIKNPRSLRIGTDLILPLRPDFQLASVASMEDDNGHAEKLSYRVRSGDSLWSIARRFSVTTEQLAAWNGMRSDGILKPGKVIKVAGGSATRSRSGVSYKVRSGDSLWSIARSHGTTVKQVCALNNLRGDSVLKPGMVLKMSGTAASAPARKVVYQVQSGDSLWSISRRFDLAVGQICNWNNLAKNQVLRPGQTLTLHVPADRRG
jgi:membrane-bound lytic murein transglycosylase D